MKKSIVLAIVLLLSSFSFLALHISTPVYGDGYGDYPPPGSGDWIINVPTYVGNETIDLKGNLTIQTGASLTLRNVTLKMNCTADWQRHIEALSGSTLKILDLDGSNFTMAEASKITSTNSNFEFNFWVRSTANFEMRNSILTECGAFAGGVPEWEGLYIQTDNAIVDHCKINNCTKGVILYNSDAVVSNNTIEWCDTGILARAWSNGTIENNVIESNKNYGIRVDGVDNTKKWSSNPLIRWNTILNTGRGTTTANAIHIQDYSAPKIIDNEIIDYTEDGIYFGEWCQATVENTAIEAQGGNYGVVGSVPRTVKLINCTIKNTAILDVLGGTSYFVFTNTTFNQSKVDFFDTVSNITVKWFLHTHINDTSGNPISGSIIRLRDNTNGTFDQNFTTDASGNLNWTVLKEFYQNKSTKILYSPYNIAVSKPGYFNKTVNVTMNTSKYITITLDSDDAPIADAGVDQTVNEDAVINFNGADSTDDVGILWYNWSFDDGNYNNGTNVNPSHSYTNSGTYIVTLKVMDTIGQSDTDTCLIFVNNVAPIANAGGDKTGNEGQAITFDGSASWDTPSDNSTLTYIWYFGDGDSMAGRVVVHAYDDNGTFTATLAVTDDNGYVASDTIEVNVSNFAPSITPVADQTGQQGVSFNLKINASDVPADVLTFSDNTTRFDINPVTGIIQFTPTNADVGNHSVKVTVTDDDGGTNSTTFKLAVLNTNDPPKLQSIPAQAATENVPFTLQVVASDPDAGDNLTYSLTAYPVGMSINPTTGLITWMPTNDAVGSHAVTIRVRDAVGLYDEKNFAITVANVNDIPMISTSSLANATEDVMYLYPIQASDVDVGDTLTYSLDSALAFLSINPSNGLLYGTPTNAHVGIHQIVVNVSDGTTYITRNFNLTVINVNDPPTLNYIPPQTASEDMLFSLQHVGQDVDVGDTLTYSLISFPTGMTVNQITGLIAWTPTNDDVSSHMVTVRVSDASGAFAERSFQITVANVNDAPTITTMTIPNATEGIMYLATVPTEDVDGNVLTYSFDSAPTFLSIDGRTGLLYGMPTNADIGVHRVIVNVSDGTTFVTRAFNFTVLNVNDLPVITSYPASVAKPGTEYIYTVIADDADAGDVLTISLVAAPEGMTINNQTGRVAWTPTDAQAGQTYQVVVQVSDGHGSTTQMFSITVGDLPAEPYRPFLDDYIWVGIVLLLIAMIALFSLGRKGND